MITSPVTRGSLCEAAIAAVLLTAFSTLMISVALATAPNGHYHWRNVQISGAGCWVTGIVAQPKVRGLFYIRCDVGGCYRWNPSGKSWIPITDSFGPQQRYSYGGESIAVDPNNANTVYIASGMWLRGEFNAGPGTIFKSTDRGNHWTALGLKGVYMGSNDNRRWGGERLAIEPGNSRVMLFGSRTQGLWRSTDSGVSWSQTALPFPHGDNEIGVQAVAFDQERPTIVYTAVDRIGVFRSTDTGATWSNISTTISSPGRLVVAQHGVVWVTYGNGVSRYAGGKWSDRTPAGKTGNPYCGLAVDPADPDTLLVSYGLWGSPEPNAIFVTTDSGAHWRDLNADIATDVPWYKANNKNGVAPFDISNFLFDPNNPKSVWFVSGGGIWNTPDIARKPWPVFYHIEKGHEELVVTALAAPPTGPELVAGTMDVDGFAFDKGIDSYPSRMFIDIGAWASATGAIAYEASDPRNMARLCVQGTLWDKPTVVAISTDSGLTWLHDDTFPTQSPFAPNKPMAPVAVAVSCGDPANMLVCVADTGTGDSVYLAKKNASSPWKVCTGLPASRGLLDEIIPIAADSVLRNTFYACVNGAVFRSTDGGGDFEPMSDGPVGAAGAPSFFKLAVQPGVPGDLWLSEDEDNPNYLSGSRQKWEGLYRSTDAGRTWTKLTSISRAITFSFGVPAPVSRYTLYIFGRDTGQASDCVFRSTDLGRTWTNIMQPGQGLGDGPWLMEASRQTPGRVFIGTSGRGIYYNVPTTKRTGQR